MNKYRTVIKLRHSDNLIYGEFYEHTPDEVEQLLDLYKQVKKMSYFSLEINGSTFVVHPDDISYLLLEGSVSNKE